MSRGFTLLEVLIAVSITAMIGVGSVQLLSNIIESRRATEIRADELANLQRFNQILGRDLEQLINRGIRDEFGNRQPALMLESGPYLLEFTRAGWRNSPFAKEPRSELQRVAYRLEALSSQPCDIARKRLASRGQETSKGDCLVRYFWPVLDRSNNSEPITQMLLEQAEGLEIEVFAAPPSTDNTTAHQQGEWLATWPALNATAVQPKAIRVRLLLPALGEIERTWLVAWGVINEP